MVREGDNLGTLASNFVASQGLKRQFMQTILGNLENLVSNVTKGRAAHNDNCDIQEKEMVLNHSEQEEQQQLATFQNESKQLEQSHSFSRNYEMKPIGAILFRLNFELGDGNAAKLAVRDGDNFEMLARSFVQEHSLQAEAEGKVLELIRHTYKMHTGDDIN